VEAEGKRSLDVQLNALFRDFDSAVAARRSTSSAHQSLYEVVHLHPCIDLDPDD
jgi:hypothetical protein